MIQTKIKFTIFDDGTKFLVQGKSPKMYLKTWKKSHQKETRIIELIATDTGDTRATVRC